MEGSSVVAAAGGSSTAVGVGTEGGGQDGGSSGKLLEAVLEHPEDEGGMVGNTHGRVGEKVQERIGRRKI
jgi:hypothetical protein